MLKLVRTSSIFLYCYLLASKASADHTVNMPYGVTPVSHDIYNLHMAAFYVCCAIAFVVFSLIAYSTLKFRKSKNAVPALFSENRTLEIIWTVIPFFILIGLAVPATLILAKIHNTDESSLTIKITGHQWKWEYEYLDNGIKFYSYLATPWDQIYNHAPKNKWFLLEVDKPLVVPINKKVKLLITSDDVIHAWWVPELGIKQDAIPGFINENWIKVSTPGEYRGQCGELCGVYHGFMPIVVKAVSEDEFNRWLVEQQTAKKTEQKNLKKLSENDFLLLGKLGYERNCAMCHQLNGAGLAFSYPPLQGSRVVTAPPNETISYIMRGVPGAAMQAFGKILGDTDLAAIITYIRQAWGNKELIQTENLRLQVTPQDVAVVRLRLSQQ